MISTGAEERRFVELRMRWKSVRAGWASSFDDDELDMRVLTALDFLEEAVDPPRNREGIEEQADAQCGERRLHSAAIHSTGRQGRVHLGR